MLADENIDCSITHLAGILALLGRSSPEDFCLYSVLKVYEISGEMDQELQRGLLLVFVLTADSTYSDPSVFPETQEHLKVELEK